MWFSKGPGTRGQTNRQVRAELERALKSEAALVARCDLYQQATDALQAERDWFHDAWVKDGKESIDDKQVVDCQAEQIAELKAKVAELEEIAVPHVETEKADEAEEPIYTALRSAEITQEIRIQASTGAVSLAKADLVGAL